MIQVTPSLALYIRYIYPGGVTTTLDYRIRTATARQLPRHMREHPAVPAGVLAERIAATVIAYAAREVAATAPGYRRTALITHLTAEVLAAPHADLFRIALDLRGVETALIALVRTQEAP